MQPAARTESLRLIILELVAPVKPSTYSQIVFLQEFDRNKLTESHSCGETQFFFSISHDIERSETESLILLIRDLIVAVKL